MKDFYEYLDKIIKNHKHNYKKNVKKGQIYAGSTRK